MGLDVFGKIGGDFVEPPANERERQAQEGRRVVTGLDDGVVMFPQTDQRAVRLNGTRQVDEFTLTVGQVGFAESRRRHGTRQHSKPPVERLDDAAYFLTFKIGNRL
jgi:hypothetical protein